MVIIFFCNNTKKKKRERKKEARWWRWWRRLSLWAWTSQLPAPSHEVGLTSFYHLHQTWQEEHSLSPSSSLSGRLNFRCPHQQATLGTRNDPGSFSPNFQDLLPPQSLSSQAEKHQPPDWILVSALVMSVTFIPTFPQVRQVTFRNNRV